MNIRKLTALGALALAVAFGSSARAGIKYWDNPDYRDFDVDCYVSGAVWNYDGIRNVGATADHSTTATTWKNLGSTGANNDVWVRYQKSGGGWSNGSAPSSLDPVGGKNLGSWTANGFTFTGDSEWRAAGSASVARIDTGTNYTIQALVTATASGQTYNTAYLMSVQKDHFAFAVDKSAGKLYWKTQSGNTSDHPFISGDDLGYMTAILNGPEKTATFFSGTTIPTSGDGFHQYSTVSGKGDNGYCLCGYTGNDGQFVGTIHFYRYYQKVLTEEELAWNRVVDERRFFDRAAPLPVTNAVVATAVAGVTGAEPSGCYAVDGRHTFIAPATTNVNGTAYVCTGYTLETRSGDDWSEPVFHKAALYQPVACVVTDTDCVRLTWQWAKAAGLANLYTADDYVWDGLVLFYDGICNVGTNLPHSTTTTTWANLGSAGAVNNMFLQRLNAAGNGWSAASDFSVVDGRDPGAWTENGFALKGDSRFRVVNTGGQNGYINTGTDYSLQMLLDAKSADQKQNFAYPFSLSADAYSFILYQSGNLAWRNDNDGWNTGNNNPPTITGTAFDYVTAIANATNNTTALFTGTTIPTSGSGFRQYDSLAAHGLERGYDLGGYGNANYDRLLVGTIKFFRQYDRSLSQAEVEQNRKVDNWRYFGISDVTNVVVQSTVPYLRGDEPDGAYAVDGSHVFTAPATVTAKGIEYECDGYTVETWGPLGNKGDGWSAATHHTGNTYAYTTAAGKVRLTWKWKATRGLRTAADYGFDDYSQAGIVWHFDGIYNQGVGVARSTTATTWKNLAPNPVTGRIFLQRLNNNGNGYANNDSTILGSLIATDGNWTNDVKGFTMKGASRWRGIGQVGPVANWTIQSLVDADVDDIANDIEYVVSASWLNFATVLRKNGNGPVPNSFHFNTQEANDVNTRPYFQNASGKYDFSTAILDSSDRTAKMFQGVTPPTGGGIADGYYQYASITPYKDTNFGIGAPAGSYDQFFIGTLKNIRYYDRVLTEEELIRNRNADAARYFGELGVTNLVVEVAEGETYACDPAPGAYFVEGSWTFTAERTSGGPIPAGFSLQDWDPVNERWTNSRGVDALSYTYDASCGVKQRIVWRSLRPFILMVR